MQSDAADEQCYCISYETREVAEYVIVSYCAIVGE